MLNATFWAIFKQQSEPEQKSYKTLFVLFQAFFHEIQAKVYVEIRQKIVYAEHQ